MISVADLLRQYCGKRQNASKKNIGDKLFPKNTKKNDRQNHRRSL